MTERSDSAQLRRLLGPAGPEVGCDECFERLDEYVDIQLAGGAPGRRMPAMAAHLHGCPTCREEWRALVAYLASATP
jgi:hypothetical protein